MIRYTLKLIDYGTEVFFILIFFGKHLLCAPKLINSLLTVFVVNF